MDERLILKLITLTSLVITIGWTVSVIIWPLSHPGFTPPGEITIAMTASMTALFAAYYKAKHPEGGDDDDDS